MYRSVITIFLLFGILMPTTISGCSRIASGISNYSDNNDLKFDLSLNQNSYEKGERIRVTLTLTNNSNMRILVNKRMAINFPSKDREVDLYLFTINDSGEKKQKPFFGSQQIIMIVPTLQPSDYYWLDPNESVQQIFSNIGFYYDELAPGNYSIQAVYQNQTDPENGEIAWKGELKSEEFLFTIEISK